MDYLKALYAVIPLIIAVILHAYKDAFLAVIRAKTITDYESAAPRRLVIAVLSARENFDRRQAIRDTWWGHYGQGRRGQHDGEDDGDPLVELKFVVGEPCLISPDYRRDEFSCREWETTLPEYYQDIPLIVQHPPAIEPGERTQQQRCGVTGGRGGGFSFMVHHDVVISKLGVHAACLDGPRAAAVTVKLVDAASPDVEVVSATFTPGSAGVLIQDYRYKPVEAYVLPRGYEGAVVVMTEGGGEEAWRSTESPLPSSPPLPPVPVVSRVNANVSGIIELYDDNSIIDGHYAAPGPAGDASSASRLASFLYHLHDAEPVRESVAGKANRTARWLQHVREEQARLRRETDAHGDLMLVPAADVYRNVTVKLLHALRHFSARNFQYFLKTDDDAFVDLGGIMAGPASAGGEELGEGGMRWVGRFRYNWPVERYGKWAERGYQSLTYPPFACGGAYMLSRDLVVWLAANSDALRRLQGEDVSLGVWLAGLDVRREDSAAWRCAGECVPGMYALPQLSPAQLRQLWHNWLTCSNPCKC